MDYVTFVLDLAGDGENRVVRDTVAYRRDRAMRPKTAFQWKVICDAKGEVIVIGIVDGKQRVIATARWHGAIAEPQHKDPATPTTYQWNLVEVAIRAELERRAAIYDRSGEPPLSPRDVDEDIDDIEEELGGKRRPSKEPRVRETPAADHDSTAEPEEAVARREASERAWDERKRKRRIFVGIALALMGISAILVPVFVCVQRNTPVVTKGPSETTISSATPTPPISRPAPPPPPPPAPAIVEPVEVRITKAATFSDAIALAKPAMTDTTEELGGGTKLFATYAVAKLRWADVDLPAETTVGHVLKDPDVERGKRMCVEGAIGSIERRDLGPRKIYVGSLQLADGDSVAFVAVGTTGDLVKRSAAKLCGAVIGRAGAAVSMVGMFDLPENRSPIVEQ